VVLVVVGLVLVIFYRRALGGDPGGDEGSRGRESGFFAESCL
jgi:hypothetical protein